MRKDIFHLEKPDMIKEAALAKPGKSWIIEIFVFYIVTAVATGLESVPVTFATLFHTANNQEFLDALTAAISTRTSLGEILSGISDYLSLLPAWITVVSLFSTGIMTVTIIMFCRLLQRRGVKTIGFRNEKPWIWEYLKGILIGFFMMGIVVLAGILTGTMTVNPGNISWIIILYLIGFMIQGMAEEVLCRGYFLTSFARKNNLWAAVIVNSLFFSLLHFANPGYNILAAANLTLCGIAFSVYVIRTGNIWGACGMHTMWNFAQGNIFGLSVSGTVTAPAFMSVTFNDGFSLWNGGGFGVESGLFYLILQLIFIGIFLIVPIAGRERSSNTATISI